MRCCPSVVPIVICPQTSSSREENEVARSSHDQGVPVEGARNNRLDPCHDFRVDPLTQEQLNKAQEITSQGDSKVVHIYTLRYATRTALRDDLLADHHHFQDIFQLKHENLLVNHYFLHSNEEDKNLFRFKAIISEEVSLAFEDAHLGSSVPIMVRKYNWVYDLLRAVMFLHSRNTVHGCIELSRIFLNAAGTLKLHLIPYQLIPRKRNANYTAKEVREGGNPTTESDIYSAASVAYFILEEKEPSPDKSDQPFANASPKAEEILFRVWSNDPTDRPSAKQMFDALCDRR